MALIPGLSTKGVIVSSFSTPYGISSINSAADVTVLSSQFAVIGSRGVSAYAPMISYLLYSPYIATMAAIKWEVGSWRWTVGVVLSQLAVV